MRINKYLSECGYCSRREADRLIEEGRIRINDAPAEKGAQVQEGDSVFADGKEVKPLEKHTYLAFHKPRGVICTLSGKEGKSLKDYLGMPGHITYAGRLDKESEGLLLLTDDGDLIDRLMTGRNGHEKEYVVTVRGELTEEKMARMRDGMHLPEIDRDTRPCRAWISGEQEFHIVLTQGINRQIRRMCKAVHLQVMQLKRIRIENIELGNIKAGQYRNLTEKETEELFKRTGIDHAGNGNTHTN